MAWAEIHWKSQVLQKETTMQVLIPDVGEPPYPTLYLLHSLTDDSYGWLRNTRIESAVRNLPLIVVMPDGYRGFFTDNHKGPAYAQHIGHELVQYVDRILPTKKQKKFRGIGGASMGGYGALRIGLGYSDTFGSIHSHAAPLARDAVFDSSRVNAAAALKDRSASFLEEMHRIFGDRVMGSAHDVLDLAIAARAKAEPPSLWIDCGSEDRNLPENRQFHSDLDKHRIEHTYREFTGTHGWDYCNERLADALNFHSASFGR